MYRSENAQHVMWTEQRSRCQASGVDPTVTLDSHISHKLTLSWTCQAPNTYNTY